MRGWPVPVGGPAAWRGPDMASRDDWIVRLTAADVEARMALITPSLDMAAVADAD